MNWATFWVTFSQTHLVTLRVTRGCEKGRGERWKKVLFVFLIGTWQLNSFCDIYVFQYLARLLSLF
jgi:hypothetical protein